MAKVAMDLLLLVIKVSMSGLHERTASGLNEANWERIRNAANLVTALGCWTVNWYCMDKERGDRNTYGG